MSSLDHTYGCACCSEVVAMLTSGLKRSSFLGGLAAAGVVSFGCGAGASAQTSSPATPGPMPTTVFVARTILTMESPALATAVAVSGGRITAVGTLDELTSHLPPGSFTVDRRFADNVLLPGLIEQHLHPLLGALAMSCVIIAIEDWKIPGNESKAALDNAQYVSRLKQAVAAAPAGELFLTWGYHQYFHGNVYRPQLDAINADRPIIVWHRSCHELILNTAALKKFGITASSLEGHGLASSQTNFAQGHFFEKGLSLIPPAMATELASPARLQLGTKRLKSWVPAKGITTICEPGTQLSRQIQDFWEASLGGDDVGFRTYFIPDGRALSDTYKGRPAELIPATKSYMSWGKGNVRWLPQQVKLFSDGAIYSQLMQVEQPYIDGHKGEWIAEPVDYRAAFAAYWAAGYHIHTHVNGDAGLKVVVDTLAANMKAHPRSDHRFTVVHFAVSTDAQVAELSKLGAIISANPSYVTSLADKYAEFGLGPERANSMVRLGTAVKHNVSISLHSDMPMAPAEPLFLMWCAVNRSTVSGRVADPQQRITAAKALRAVTIEAAYSLNLESEIGSIKPGKRADFTILAADPLSVEPAKIKDIGVIATVFEGRVVMPNAPATAPAYPDGGSVGTHALNSSVG